MRNVVRNSNTMPETCPSKPDKKSMEFSFEMGSAKNDPEICLQIRESPMPQKNLDLIGSQHPVNEIASDSKLSNIAKDSQSTQLTRLEAANTGSDNARATNIQHQVRPKIDKYAALKVRVMGRKNYSNKKSAPEKTTKAKAESIDSQISNNSGEQARKYSDTPKKSKSSYNNRRFEDDHQEEPLFDFMRKNKMEEELNKLKQSTIKNQLISEYMVNRRESAQNKNDGLAEYSAENIVGKKSSHPESFKYDYKISISSKKVPSSMNSVAVSKAELDGQDNVSESNINPSNWEQLRKGKLEFDEKLPKSLLLKPIAFRINTGGSKSKVNVEVRKADKVKDSIFLPDAKTEKPTSRVNANELPNLNHSVQAEPAVDNQQPQYIDERNRKDALPQISKSEKRISSMSPRLAIEELRQLDISEENAVAVKPKGSPYSSQQQSNDNKKDKNTRLIKFNYDEGKSVSQSELRDTKLLKNLEAEVEMVILDNEIPKEIEFKDKSVKQYRKDEKMEEERVQKKREYNQNDNECTSKSKKEQKTNKKVAQDLLDEQVHQESEEAKKYAQYLQVRRRDPIIKRHQMDEDKSLHAFNSEDPRSKYLEYDVLPDDRENNKLKEEIQFKKQTHVLPKNRIRSNSRVQEKAETTAKVAPVKTAKHTSEWDWLVDTEKVDNLVEEKEQKNQHEDPSKYPPKYPPRYHHLVDFISKEEINVNKVKEAKKLERNLKLKQKLNKKSGAQVEESQAQFNEMPREGEFKVLDRPKFTLPASASPVNPQSSDKRPTEFGYSVPTNKTSELKHVELSHPPRTERGPEQVPTDKHLDVSIDSNQLSKRGAKTQQKPISERTIPKRMESQLGKISKRLASIMTKGQKDTINHRERPVAYEGNDPYGTDEVGHTKTSYSNIGAQDNSNKKIAVKPFHPPLNPRVRIPRPPFDVRDQEYHTINYRPQAELQRNSMLPQMQLSVASQSIHASANVTKLPRPVLKLPPFMMRSSVLAIELGFFAALLSRYRGGCK